MIASHGFRLQPPTEHDSSVYHGVAGMSHTLDQSIEAGAIQSFPRKADAMAAAKEAGWGRDVVRLQRRFERVWIVAAYSPINRTLRVPTLALRSHNGHKEMPVALFVSEGDAA